MAKLSAKFSIYPTFPLTVECKDSDHYLYSLNDGEYHIQIELPFMEGSPKNGLVNSDLYKRLVDKVEINVTKEVGDIPEIPINEKGGRDLSKVSSYYNNLKGGYSKVAGKYYKRLIKFVKFHLKQPFQDDKYIDIDQLSNPSWSYEDGNPIGTISPIFHAQRIPGFDDDTLGSETLKIEHANTVEEKLKLDVGIELYQEILSDAQAAIFSGNIRRAVFEMAVVCELYTKRKYFYEGGASGLAFDYFEDKGKIKVTVLELISSIADEALGESYKKHSPQNFSNIDYLFRCRNKVAHRGQVSFKDDGGNLINPDLKLVKSWYESVENLLAWLSTK